MEPQGFQRSRCVPSGVYRAKLIRIDGRRKYRSIGKIAFEIIEGDYAGHELIGASQDISTKENRLREIVWVYIPVLDQPDPRQYFGLEYWVRVEHISWAKTSRVVSAELV